MSEKIFKTSLSMEEIENNFKDTNFFDGVMEGLEEEKKKEKGTAKSETIARKRSLPDVNVSQIRNALSSILQNGRSMGIRQKQSDTDSKKIDVFNQSGSFADSEIMKYVFVSKTLGVIYETRIFIRQATRWRNRHKQINDTSCHK